MILFPLMTLSAAVEYGGSISEAEVGTLFLFHSILSPFRGGGPGFDLCCDLKDPYCPLGSGPGVNPLCMGK